MLDLEDSDRGLLSTKLVLQDKFTECYRGSKKNTAKSVPAEACVSLP